MHRGLYNNVKSILKKNVGTIIQRKVQRELQTYGLNAKTLKFRVFSKFLVSTLV